MSKIKKDVINLPEKDDTKIVKKDEIEITKKDVKKLDKDDPKIDKTVKSIKKDEIITPIKENKVKSESTINLAKDNKVVNLEFNLNANNLLEVIKNRKEDIYLYDFNTTFEKKKKAYEKDLINNFLLSICINNISIVDLQNIIDKVNLNRKEIIKNSYCLSILKYRFCNYLGFKDLLLDGFFDLGHTSTSSENSNYLTDVNKFKDQDLFIMKNQTRYQTREVILVDAKKDYQLNSLLDKCKLLERNSSIYQKIIEKILILLGDNSIDRDFNKFVTYYANKNNTNIINICDVRDGLDRHKSLLFKYLCDNIGLNCCLVRSNTINEDGFIVEDHCWNLIQINNIKLVVDFRYNNGKIMEPSNNFTKSYFKLNLI